MTTTTHTLIGVIIGTTVGSPILGFILGLVSHFLVDMIPHGDMFLGENFRVRKHKRAQAVGYAALDVMVATILLVILGNFLPNEVSQSPVYIASIFGSVLPDVLVGLSDLFKNKLSDKYHKFHFFFHDYFAKHGDVKLRNSLLLQSIFIIVVIAWLG